MSYSVSKCWAKTTTKLQGLTLQQTEINVTLKKLNTTAYRKDVKISDIREERRKTASMMNCRPAAMFITYNTYWCLIRRDERSSSFHSCCRSEETRERLRISAETQTPVNAAERPLPRERCREITANSCYWQRIQLPSSATLQQAAYRAKHGELRCKPCNSLESEANA